MTHFNLDQRNRMTIKGYPAIRPFSSFLPGIAGLYGIPIWSFYVNRGQAISSFGIESKDSPIMEFQPANKAYQLTPLIGFRTFIKIQNHTDVKLYEPFAPWNGVGPEYQVMTIGMNELVLEEENQALNLRTRVQYFILPNDSFGGLVRLVTITNTGKYNIPFEILDGMPCVIPYGVNNNLLKEIGRTVEAWMEVYNLEANEPFYRLRASVVDRAEVETYEAGHFIVAFVEDNKPLRTLVDPFLVFGQETSFFQPEGFMCHPLKSLYSAKQITCGLTPCGFSAYEDDLSSGQSVTISSIYGHIGSQDLLKQTIPGIIRTSYLQKKYSEAVALCVDLTDVVETHTASPIFDAYCRQNLLDNILRGGWPVQLNKHIFTVYSRKHGDLERDYNAFYLTPEAYSQGETSYRDVIQNRRDNVQLNPAVEDFDIRTFLSLIQADGYNPRAIKGFSFNLSPKKRKALLRYTLEPGKLLEILNKPFTPGSLLRAIHERNISIQISPEEFILLAIGDADQMLEADFHEGYWIDHWEYNLDLIESYLRIYPDREEDMLFGHADIPFYDSPMVVQPRSKKHLLVNGLPRQLNSLVQDRDKVKQLAKRKKLHHWVRTRAGQIYRVTVFSKLLLIVLLKYSSMDPWGMGIEMEASRPGWDDAVNGLPALFGSGMAETYELLRWIIYLQEVSTTYPSQVVKIPQEAFDLLNELLHQINVSRNSTDEAKVYKYWDSISTARETYRERTRRGFVGTEQPISCKDLGIILDSYREKVVEGVNRAIELNQGIPPTYITYRVDEYDILQERDSQGHFYIHPKKFTPVMMPLFLEGPVRALKTQSDVGSARQLYKRVKDSPLFDRKLQMYKINASLENQPQDIGRARAFAPGWLENESIWLHMEYKYILEVLKAGLFDLFLDDFKKVLVPFLNPDVYGRSPLENSSFLVSSAHQDETLHGKGFIARLSGSTAEFISMWNIMMVGKQPFMVHNGQLCLTFQPVLPGWLFTQEGEVSFRFLGKCAVTYHNPAKVDTHSLQPQYYLVHMQDGSIRKILGQTIKPPIAEMVRNGQIKKTDVWFK